MNNRDIAFFLLISMLFPIILIGTSIRGYFDAMRYVELVISLILVIIIIFIARMLSKIALGKKNKVDVK